MGAHLCMIIIVAVFFQKDIFNPQLCYLIIAQAAASSGSFLRQVSQERKREGGEGGGAKKGGKHKKGKGRRDDGNESWELIFMPKEKVKKVSLSLMCLFLLLD